MKSLFLVVPCYNEEEVLMETARRLSAKLNGLMKNDIISINSRILFVDDGSKDKTWELIKQLHAENQLVFGISLTHNEGQQNAILAGLMTAKEYSDIMISLDADLQDDIDVIDKMLDAYYQGNDIVYGVKSTRKNETYFRKFLAESFYRTAKMIGINMVNHNSSCRLMSRRAVESLSGYSEVNLFLPGLIPLLGFKNTIINYKQKERIAGKTKYSLRQLFSLALEAITSFSLKPIHYISIFGVIFFLISVGTLIVMLVNTIIGKAESWLLLLASICTVVGMLLISIGFIGEYVGKSYFEVKNRPRYFISENLIDCKSTEET